MANTSWEILTPVAAEPVSLADMKTFLRVDYTDEDTLIQQFISDARQYAESVTFRSLAPQQIRATIEPGRVPEGALSGPIGGDFDPYRLNERITTVPFGFYGPIFDLPWHPITQISTVEYQLTPFDGQPAATMQWTSLSQFDANNNLNWILDTNMQPMNIILRPLLVANRYRFTYYAGYNDAAHTYVTGAVPSQITNQIKALVSFWFDNRQGQSIPDDITMALARNRIFTL